MHSLRSIAVFCGSRSGNNPLFEEHATELGRLLAENKISIIYGGGRNGLMGAMANAAMENKGNVIGIMPESIAATEHRHDAITELVIVDSMHTRKKMLFERCDSAIILPGGYGTLDELFEMLTWNQLNIHDKKIFFMNTDGFYDHLLKHIHHMQDEQFLYLQPHENIVVLTEPHQILEHL